MVYDSGTIFEPKILDIKPEDLQARFMEGVRNVAAVSLSIGYPTVASVPHSIINGFKNLLAVAATTEITFKEAETVKEYIKVCDDWISLVTYYCQVMMYNVLLMWLFRILASLL